MKQAKGWRKDHAINKIVGEAKFITTSGGNQDKSFREVMHFLQSGKDRVIRVGLLDGVVWFVDTGLYA
ncbi:MAG: hypothetical protein ACUVR2_10565, partial [Anaerolineae bacterium]